MPHTPRHAKSPPLLKSIATVSLSGSLPEKLEAAASVGFDAVEIFENDLLTFDGSPEEVRRITENLGLEIAVFQPFRDFEAMAEPQRTRNLDRAERKFDVMQALGTDLLLVCSNTQAGAIDDDARAVADLAEMAERARLRGLRVGYEALAWGRHVNRWGHAWRIVQKAAHPALGLIGITEGLRLTDKLRAVRCGVDHVLSSPWLPEELNASVDNLLLRLSQSEQLVESHVLQLDSRFRVLRGPAGEQALSRSEFLLLLAFGKAPGHQLEIWEIYEVLKKNEDEFPKQALEAQIYRLRKKLRDAGAGKQVLKSIRLQGYQLCNPIKIN